MIWRNGQLIDDDTPVAVGSDRGLMLGDGLFETIKVSRGRALFLAKHLARMQVAGSEIGLRINRQELRQGVQDILTAQNASEGALRITVTRGPGPRGLSPIPQTDQHPVSLIAFHDSGSQMPPQEHPDRLVEAPFIRPAGALSSRHKTLSYADNLSAIAYARAERATDVLFFNERGEVACTAMANIFVRTGLGYLTPPLSAGILPGIVRSVLLEEAAAGSLSIEVRPLKADDLRDRLLFRSNSLLGVRPAWYDDRTSTLRPAMDEDEGMLEGLYRLAERREEGA